MLTESFPTLTLPIFAPAMTSIFLFQRKNYGSDVNERDLSSERVEDVRKLAADCAGSDNRHGLRRFFENENFVGRKNVGLVQLEACLRKTFHTRTGRNHDRFLRLVLFFLAVRALY